MSKTATQPPQVSLMLPTVLIYKPSVSVLAAAILLLLVATSELHAWQVANTPRQANQANQKTDPAKLTGFSWDRVPLNLHFGKRTRQDLTDDEIKFIAQHSNFISLEKKHLTRVHGNTEAGIADSAKRIVAIRPDAKVLFYFNAFINWGGYEAFDSYQDQWTLKDSEGKVVTHSSGTARPDPSNADFRQWWSDVVATANRDPSIGGVFVDALPQALSRGIVKKVGKEKAQQIVEGLREMMAMTKRKLGADKIVLANGLRGNDYREILDWEGIDGVMIEHFDAFGSTTPEKIKADLDSITLAAQKGKFVVLKGWPGFNWMDAETVSQPHKQLLKLARENITFPLACFLVAAEPGSHFCYAWGYSHDDGMLDAYPEFDRKLGPPTGPANWDGMVATRNFEHASVWVDLKTKEAKIDWQSEKSP